MDFEKRIAPVNQTSPPSHGIDWRFLLPIDEKTRMLVIGDEQSDYGSSFHELDISIKRMPPDKAELVAGQSSLPFVPGSFDVVAAPLGISRTSTMSGRTGLVESLRSVRRLIRPGGTLLFGLLNRWDFRRKGGELSYATSTREIVRLLRKMGFETLRFYGAIPEPLVPEYIFPLDAQSLGFVLDHRYQHKLPNYFLKLTKTPLVNVLMDFLPFYYVVARVGE